MCENNGQTAISSPKEPTQSESIAKLAGALAKAQLEIEGAIKDSNNPFFKSSYADLASVWAACRKPLGENGLAILQTTEPCEGGLIALITTLAHSSGEFVKGRLELKPAKQDAQGVGSVITYGRRYALAAMVGVAPLDDDDGEAAVGRQHGKSNGTPSDKKKPSKKPDDVAVPQTEIISDRIKACKATKELENVWKKHVNPVTWQDDEYAMLKNLAASRKAEIIAGLKEEKGSKKATQKEETTLEKVKKYAAKVKALNKSYGDAWLLQQCGNFGFSNPEEMDEKNLQQLLAKLVDKGLELKATTEEKEHGKLAA